MSKHGWTYKTIGDVAEVTDYVANGSFATLRENVTYLNSPGYAILVRLADYSNNFDPQKFVYVDEHAYNFLAKSKLEGGEIIMSNVGSLGKQFICPKLDIPMTLAPNSIVIKTNHNRYYFYYFGSAAFKKDLSTISSQTALPKFNKTSFKKLPVPVPEMAEQEAIVTELDEINEAIEDLQQQVADLDTLAQATFYDMFGDPVTNPKAWPVKKWEDVLTIINGKNQREIENANGQYPICGSGGIMGYGDSYLCPEYTTIIGRKGNINSPIYMKEKFWNVDTAFGLVANTEVLMPIVLFYFCVFYDFETHNVAVTIPSLRKADLLKINIPLPPLSLQQEFAAKVEAIESAKAELNALIAEMQTLLASRMDYYFE